jgi:predicted enzyme related to lactoylglutathione lyase
MVQRQGREGAQAMNLGFVVLYVHDMDKARAFYTDVLGMIVVDAVSSPTFVTLRPAGGSLIALQDKAAAKFPPGHEEQPGSMELSFEVDDVDATWRRWKEQGVEIVSDPIDLPFGRYFMAKDPEGHYLSAYRFAASSPTN